MRTLGGEGGGWNLTNGSMLQASIGMLQSIADIIESLGPVLLKISLCMVSVFSFPQGEMHQTCTIDASNFT